jgi:hypothetical protein
MPTIVKKDHQVSADVEVDIPHKILVPIFLESCDDEELDEVYDWLDDKGLLEKDHPEVITENVYYDFPDDGSYSDSELNDSLWKISDARLQLTMDDLEELKRIAGKYR